MYDSHESAAVSHEECGETKNISELNKYVFIRPLRDDDTLRAEQFLAEKDMEYLEIEEFSFILIGWNPTEIVGLYSDCGSAFADATATHRILTWVQ